MNMLFSYEETIILIKLLIAHVLTDFFWQPDKWVKEKCIHTWKSKYLYYHGLLTGIVAWLLLFNGHLWWAALLIAVTHTTIDGIKLQASLALKNRPQRTTVEKAKTGLRYFLTDQLGHIIVIAATWLLIIKGFDQLSEGITRAVSSYPLLLRLLGYLIVTGPVGYYIGFFTKRWVDDLNMQDSLQEAGRWIGILERLLILTLVYAEQYAAIGFLIAAKSLLRVIDKPDRSNTEPGFIQPFSSRKHTEYVLIGTFLSLSVSLITGLIINYLIKI